MPGFAVFCTFSGIAVQCIRFDVNPRHQLVVEPAPDVDEPLLYTDEDWIPHGAGFLAGLTALRDKKRFEA